MGGPPGWAAASGAAGLAETAAEEARATVDMQRFPVHGAVRHEEEAGRPGLIGRGKAAEWQLFLQHRHVAVPVGSERSRQQRRVGRTGWQRVHAAQREFEREAAGGGFHGGRGCGEYGRALGGRAVGERAGINVTDASGASRSPSVRSVWIAARIRSSKARRRWSTSVSSTLPAAKVPASNTRWSTRPVWGRLDDYVRAIVAAFFVAVFSVGSIYLAPDLKTPAEWVPWVQGEGVQEQVRT
jgi:hypothetical protein